MASLLVVPRRTPSALRAIVQPAATRSLSTPAPSPQASTSTSSDSPSEPNTHYRITLRRSAISLGERKKGTLVALGIHRRMQTVYHLHNPETAGKILALKELVEVENVPASAVRTKTEQKWERKAPRGFVVVRNSIPQRS
ncbi:hypothetical protein FA95DRAFT_1555654 [Auriscalpium vulgare]|uniref:Uncharacterized protein n=1 Tax=Auriscalpium vulgare TaxID=40419 RepID=A0ACB8S380_9AGAM|nr:hypothetical protein FA95DRAFT_1555654 [Auriscalpium vulgare]